MSHLSPSPGENREHGVQPHPSFELEIEEGQQNKPQMTDIMEYLGQQSYYYDNITNEEVQYLVVFYNKPPLPQKTFMYNVYVVVIYI